MHDLGVVGLVFFEVFVPAEAAWPPPGEEHFVDALPVGLGGALNTASVARALGLDVALISPRGGGLTDLAIAARVAALGLHDLPWPAPSDGAITLVRSTPHDRAFLSAIAPGTLAGCPQLPAARWIHVGGLGEAELLADRLAEARGAGARVSVSAGWDPPRLAALRARLEAGSTTPPWDLFFANAREAEALVGTAEGAEHLLAGRVATDVVVTHGAHGARAVLSGVRCAVAAEPVDVLDPTGAGDAFAAGVLAGCVRGLASEACLALGARSAARVLGQRGGVVG
jgi:sugar/nucleoside kinase (ribokinase family)